MGSMIEALANYNPNAFAQGNQMRDQALQTGKLQQQGLVEQNAQEGIKTKLMQQQMKDNDILQRAYVNTNGDPNEIRRYMVSNGISAPGYMGWQQHDMALRKSVMDLSKEQQGMLVQTHQQAGDIVDSVQKIQDPAQQKAAYAQNLQRLQQLAPDVQWKDPNSLTPEDLQLYNGIVGHAMKTLEQAKVGAETGKAASEIPLNYARTGAEQAAAKKSAAEEAKLIAETPGSKAKSDIEVRQAAAMASMKPEDWDQQVDSAVPPAGNNAPLNARTKALVRSAVSMGLPLSAVQAVIKDASDQLGRTEQAVRTAQATAPIKINVGTQLAGAQAGARAEAGGLTQDDYARAGEQYGRTGVMPPMGRDSVTRAKIEHAKNEWARDNGLKPADLVTMQAAYSGDKESLKKFQGQRDQIVSFEQTAQKNLDLFLNAAAKIPDAGSPWVNKPLRMLDDRMLGSTQLAAVNAARQVANNEIAKVTSGGGLSGVLSDSARHEVQDYNPKDATLAQTLAVAKILKQDMANRHQSMDATLGDIKSRIGGGQASLVDAKQQASTPASAPKVEKWDFDANGKLVKK